MRFILVFLFVASTLISCASLYEAGGTPRTMVQGVYESVDEFTGEGERFVVVTYQPFFGDNYSISFHFDSEGTHTQILLGFQGGKWHFIDKAIAKVDGEFIDLGKSLDTKRVVIAASNLLETVLMAPNLELIEAVKKGESLTIRYSGSNGYTDVDFSEEQLQLLKANL